MSEYFFIVFILTILVTRAFLFAYPISSPNIGRFRTHHYMFGIVAAGIGLAIQSVTLYAIGLGLFVDELSYLLMRGKTHRENFSTFSLVGTIVFVIIGFLLKNYLVSPFRG